MPKKVTVNKYKRTRRKCSLGSSIWEKSSGLGEEELHNLLEMLYKQTLSLEIQYFWRWKLGNGGRFSVKSHHAKMLIRDETIFPHDSVWFPGRQERCFFICLSTRRAILMAKNLRKRRITYISCALCAETRARMRIAFYYLVRLLQGYGEWFWDCFDYRGLCRDDKGRFVLFGF